MEVRFLIAMIGVVVIGALYAAINVSPNKYKSREALISHPVLGVLIVCLCMVGGGAIIGSFNQSLIKGFIAVACVVLGYVLSWYIIKTPERKYMKQQQN